MALFWRNKQEDEQEATPLQEVYMVDYQEPAPFSKAMLLLTLKEHRSFLLVMGGYVALFLSQILFVIRYGFAFARLDYHYLCYHPAYYLVLLLGGIVLFIFSSNHDILHFQNRVRLLLGLSLFTVWGMFLRIGFLLLSLLVLRRIFQMTPTPVLSEDYLVQTGHTVVLYYTGFMIFAFIVVLTKLLQNDMLMAQIYSFRLKYAYDSRKDKERYYDLNVIKNMRDGSDIIVKEADRFLGVLVNGVSGTGKTSMTMVRAIDNDLRARARIEDLQKRELVRWLKNGMAYRAEDFTQYHVSHFQPMPGFEKAFEDTFVKRYRSCGIVAVAPNATTLDKIYDLARLKGISCHRVDGTLTDAIGHKDGYRGFNPFYISPKIKNGPFTVYQLAVNQRAEIFRDVMEALNTLSGSADAYFSNVSKNTAYNFTILAILTIPLKVKRQANMTDVQFLIDSRDKPEVMAELVELFDTLDIQTKNAFQESRNFIVNTYLCSQRLVQTNVQHSSGIQIQIDSFLSNPLIQNVFTVNDELTIDIDRILEQGEVLVYNYMIEIGNISATAYGLFFLLSFNAAVKRRPGDEDTRPPCFFYIDELPVLLSPQVVSDACDLWRQYRCAFMGLIQSLDQMDKSDTTKYLRTSLLKCGTHILFGRCSIADMEEYSKLAGKEMRYDKQESYSQNSILDDNPTASRSDRYLMVEKEILPQSDIRYRGFQEVTVFTTDQGNALRPFYGKMRFLEKKDWRPVKRVYIDWSQYDVCVPPTPEVESIREEVLALITFPVSPVKILPQDYLDETSLDYGTNERIVNLWEPGYKPKQSYRLFEEREEMERNRREKRLGGAKGKKTGGPKVGGVFDGDGDGDSDGDDNEGEEA